VHYYRRHSTSIKICVIIRRLVAHFEFNGASSVNSRLHSRPDPFTPLSLYSLSKNKNPYLSSHLYFWKLKTLDLLFTEPPFSSAVTSLPPRTRLGSSSSFAIHPPLTSQFTLLRRHGSPSSGFYYKTPTTTRTRRSPAVSHMTGSLSPPPFSLNFLTTKHNEVDILF
jgi:hypothetical protein